MTPRLGVPLDTGTRRVATGWRDENGFFVYIQVYRPLLCLDCLSEIRQEFKKEGNLLKRGSVEESGSTFTRGPSTEWTEGLSESGFCVARNKTDFSFSHKVKK